MSSRLGLIWHDQYVITHHTAFQDVWLDFQPITGSTSFDYPTTSQAIVNYHVGVRCIVTVPKERATSTMYM